MKALTIWQPWASLIMAGAKPYEFRSWPAPRWVQGQRIAIHAGARRVRKDEIADLLLRLQNSLAWTTGLVPDVALPVLEKAHGAPGSLPLASVLGTAVLGVPVRSNEVAAELGAPVINDSDRDEHSNWAWPLTDVQALEPFVPARGAQGFWNWKEPADA